MQPEEDSPICVGGVGGSGTRVMADILDGLRVHMGHWRNHAEDNLLFHAMFIRRPWLEHQLDGDGDAIRRRLRAFAGASVRPSRLRAPSRAALALGAYNRMQAPRRKLRRVAATFAALGRARRAGDPARLGYRAWGWKEPNTHLVARHVADTFPRCRYIHMMRHGLDMAFSANHGQLRRWGGRFGVDASPRTDDLPQRALKYWIRANDEVLETLREGLPDRHLVVRFIDMCDESERLVDDVASLVGLEPSEATRERLAAIPQRPPSVGRYREHNLDRFEEHDLRAVERLGFPVDA